MVERSDGWFMRHARERVLPVGWVCSCLIVLKCV